MGVTTYNFTHSLLGKGFQRIFVKVCVKSILRIVFTYIINFRNALLKCITKTVNYVVLNCGVRPLNSFSPFSCSGFFGQT